MEVIDATVENHGTIFILQPLTDDASNWIEENVSENAQWFGGGLAVGHRYIENLVQGMINAGLIVK